MTSHERISKVLRFEKPDRLPLIEWAPHWDKTIARWKQEGMPPEYKTSQEINAYFGLDAITSFWAKPRTRNCPRPSGHGLPIISSEAEYEKILPYLYPKPAINSADMEYNKRQAEENGAAVGCCVEGFFWGPRELLGIEGHLYSFYDCPELVKRINRDLLEFNKRAADEILAEFNATYFIISEDMSYNHGPMISKNIFDEFIAPYAEEYAAYLHERGQIVILDSDGLIDDLVDWFTDIGYDGVMPLEKQAGVDAPAYRQKYPKLIMIGGFDKMCMWKGEAAMRREFERLLPLWESGGFILGCDHQTPPQVSIEDYRNYVRLMKEYAGIR